MHNWSLVYRSAYVTFTAAVSNSASGRIEKVEKIYISEVLFFIALNVPLGPVIISMWRRDLHRARL